MEMVESPHILPILSKNHDFKHHGSPSNVAKVNYYVNQLQLLFFIARYQPVSTHNLDI